MQLRRVKQTSNNLNTLEQLNALSRKICRERPSLDEFDDMLHQVKKQQPYPTWLHILASAVGASAFCLFFGGGVIESVITFVIGAIISVVMNYPNARLNSMAKTVISSFIAATFAGLASVVIKDLDVNSVIIGAIMLLVPGMIFGTAMRDLFCGDLIAGTLKILQAIIQTLMIGFGYMLSYALIGDRLIPEIIEVDDDLFIIQLITSFVTSISFAIVFKTNKRHLINAGIAGVLTYAAYLSLDVLTSSLFWAAFVSSFVAALFAEVNARLKKAPSVVLLMAGVIPIVPGGYLYRSVRDLIRGSNSTAMSALGTAGAVALGIAGGIVTLTIVFGLVRDYVSNKKKQRSNR